MVVHEFLTVMFQLIRQTIQAFFKASEASFGGLGAVAPKEKETKEKKERKPV